MELETVMRPEHYVQGLRDFCQAVRERIGEKFTLVEIGSFMGESAIVFAQEFPKAKIICVDPFLGGYDDNDFSSKADYGKVEAHFDFRVKEYPNIKKMKKFSSEVSIKCDLVYLDGSHTYEAVKEDILHWKPLVKKIMSGHDYPYDGVSRSVTELLGPPDATFQDTSWIKYVS